MSELKATLKDAKMAIKEKKYDDALMLCKNALKIDRKNYVALVMFGRVCQELEKFEDSRKSLLLCTQLDPELAIAWQGLNTLHEKCPQIFQKNEALNLLAKLETMTDDKEKLKNIADRKAQLCTVEEKPYKEVNIPITVGSSIGIGSKIEETPPPKKVSKDDLLTQTWNYIEALLSNRTIALQHQDELETLISSFTELSIGSEHKGESGRWLRIGLHYLAANCPVKAIRALQFAVQINPNDSMCFECLGDAYLARGSHTAALKLYSQAINLSNTDVFYLKGQIAYIKHITGDLLGSIMDYESLLNYSPPMEVRVVALVGVAEVLMSRAQKYLQQNLFSNVKKDCMRAIQCFSVVASQNPHHVTAWKRISDACALQAGLPASLSPYEIPAHLLNMTASSEHSVKIDKKELLLFGARCLAVAVKIAGGNAALWHDLGVNLFLQRWAEHPSVTGQWMQSEPNCREDLQKALSCIKKSLSMDASSANAWNSLGVVAAFMDQCPTHSNNTSAENFMHSCNTEDDLALAQHSFLKSLEIRPSTEAWTHLGALYVSQGDNTLAGDAFQRARGLDPGYVACWVGQGMAKVADKCAEKFNLFRHSTVLGIHPESCVGSADLVMGGVPQQWKRDTKFLVQNASDSMVFYSRDKELDPVGLNTCGLLFEMIGLQKSSEIYFIKAIDVCAKNPDIPDEIKDDIRANYARVLTALDKPKEAIRQYSLIKEPNFYSECGAAFAKMKDGDLANAYQTYSSVVEWMNPTDAQKGYVFIAMALLQYKLKRMDDVKTLLFQSSCLSDNAVQALVSLAALGQMESDRNLSAAALGELEKYADKTEHAYQISFLQATAVMLKGDFVEAKLILCRALHKYPQLAKIWRFLAQVLLSIRGHNSTERIKLASGAISAASKAMVISQASGDNANVQLDVTLKALACVLSEKEQQLAATSIIPKKRKSKKKEESTCAPPTAVKINSLVEAQRAVLMCPSNHNTWAVLVAALKDGKMKRNLANAICKRTSGELQAWFQGVTAK